MEALERQVEETARQQAALLRDVSNVRAKLTDGKDLSPRLAQLLELLPAYVGKVERLSSEMHRVRLRAEDVERRSKAVLALEVARQQREQAHDAAVALAQAGAAPGPRPNQLGARKSKQREASIED